MPAPYEADRGALLRIEFGTADSNQYLTQPVVPVVPKKRGWLPLLVVLFLISYALMTLLIVEQGQTIESQRALIRELFHDSTELSASRMKAQADHAKKPGPAIPQNRTQAQTQTPSTQIPSTQAQNKQAPSSQADVQHRAQSQKPPKARRQTPAQPAADLGDARRSLITI